MSAELHSQDADGLSIDKELKVIEDDIIRIKNALYGGQNKNSIWDNEDDISDSENDVEEEDDRSDEPDASPKSKMPDDKSEVADDTSQALCVFDVDSESALENFLYLNRMYQELLQETINEMELLLMSNREMQREIQDQLTTKMKDRKPLIRSGLDSFSVPYFKDIRGHVPPPNADTARKTENCELKKTSLPRYWSEKEKQLLRDAIKRSAVEIAVQPIMSRIEYLSVEMQNKDLSVEDKIRKRDELKHKQKQLKEISEMEKESSQITNCDWLKISVVEFSGTRSALDCELYWKNYLHPSINKNRWSKEEIGKLRNLVKDKGPRNWESVAESLGTSRTALQCFEKYQTKLNNEFRKGKWTAEETDQLMEIVESCRVGDFIPWYQVAYYMDGRTQSQIWQHWEYHCNPEIRKGRWTEQEDLLLIAAVWMLGIGNWSKIKQYVPGRTSVQCDERWFNTLHPSIKFGGWSPVEDKMLLLLVKQHGKKWAFVASHLTGRTDNMAWNRWKMLTKPSKQGNEGTTTALSQSSAYRDGVYRRFVKCLNCLLKRKIPGCVISKSDVMELMTDRSYPRVSNDTPDSIRHKVSRIMAQWPLNNLVNFLVAKKTHARTSDSTILDGELNDYFILMQGRRKRGRPPKIVTVYEDEVVYTEWVQEMTKIFSAKCSFQSSSTDIPFLPPSLRSLQAFRSLLRLQSRLQLQDTESLPADSCRSGNVGEPHGSEHCTSDGESYENLFAKFASVFFWPALLSNIKPEEEENHSIRQRALRESRRVDSHGRRRRKRKRKNVKTVEELPQPPTADVVVELPTPETTLDGEVTVKKARGRPRGKLKKVEVTAVRKSTRHSSNRTKSIDS